MTARTKPPARRYHAAVWSEPLITELGRPGRRGVVPPAVEPGIAEMVGSAESLVPPGPGDRRRRHCRN